MTDATKTEALLERLEAKAKEQPNRIEVAICIETEAAETIRALLKENERLQGRADFECDLNDLDWF